MTRYRRELLFNLRRQIARGEAQVEITTRRVLQQLQHDPTLQRWAVVLSAPVIP